MPVRQYSQIVNDAIKQLAATSTITQLGSGAKARANMEVIAAELASQNRAMSNDLKQGNPSTATKTNLEKIADLFNIVKIRRAAASSSLGDLNVKFYVDSSVGTFGALATLPVIPIGTILSTSGGTPIKYEVTSTTGAVSPLANSYYVGVQAIQTGTSFNIGRNTLISHPFGINGLQVTNSFPISNGINDEQDEQLRYRVFNAVRSLETANDKALFIAARVIPGVGDIKIIPRLFGIGTTAILVRPVTGSITPSSIVNAVRLSVSSIQAASTKVVVSQPDLIGFSFEIVVNYSKPMTTTEKSIITSRIIATISNYFNVLTIGNDISFNDISTAISRVDPSIKSLGRENGVFGRVWVHTSEQASKFDPRHKAELLLFSATSQYTIASHGLAIVEEASLPITVIHGAEG